MGLVMGDSGIDDGAEVNVVDDGEVHGAVEHLLAFIGDGDEGVRIASGDVEVTCLCARR